MDNWVVFPFSSLQTVPPWALLQALKFLMRVAICGLEMFISYYILTLRINFTRWWICKYEIGE